MILVTGAAGKTGRAVIRALLERDKAVRAFVHRPEQKELMQELGAAQVVHGDLADRSTIRRAVDGVESIYHICPNVDPLEMEYAELLIGEAISAYVPHFAYHSVLHPQTKRMIHHWRKLRVEEALFESGLSFTIVQPCAYMQNLRAHKASILSRGVIEVPYSLRAQLSLIDLQDVAAAVATVLCDPEHRGAIYELAGPEALNHVQIAATFSKVLNQPVKAEQISVAEWSTDAQSKGLSDYQLQALSAMFVYYDQFGFSGNSNVLACLLGRRPNTLEDVVGRMMVAQQ